MFNKKISRKGTYSTQWDYIVDRFGEGTEDLIPFTISDMDFQTSPEIINALNKRVEHGVFGYSRWKNKDYLDAITSWYKSQYNVLVKEEWITYAPSVIYSVAKLIELSSHKDEGIMLLDVRYDGFTKITDQYKVHEIPLIENTIGNYSLDFNKLEETMIKGVKILLISNPQNPTGKVWTENELKEMVQLAEKYNVMIISDEIHIDIHRQKVNSILNVSTSENIVVVSSPSKTFNIASLGGSYVISSNKKVLKELSDKIKYQESLSSPNIMGIIATIEGYTNSQQWLNNLNDYITKNMEYFQSKINNYKGIQVYIPGASYLLWVDISQTTYSVSEFVERLIENGNVAVMNGSVYGDKNKIRINVACSREKLDYLIQGIYKST